MPDEEDSGLRIPAFQAGGLVRETGIALVHEGEFIMPAPGSEATIEPAEMSTQGEVNYYFPVEVVIVGSLPEAEREAIEARIWERLNDALERLV
ncbi:MAG TPA: hypothetical protein VJU84_11340 [Pyrinomonadaceae bacterium]|nr:hypothetical protein [Pyrinomonadaceae bacterium]